MCTLIGMNGLEEKSDQKRVSYSVWRIVKLSAITLVCIVLFVTATAYAFISLKKDWLLERLQGTINRMQSGDLLIGDADLSPFKDLPNITIRLNDVSYFEKKDKGRSTPEFPILRATHLFVAFKVWPLVKESRLEISNVIVAEAELNLEEYEDGTLNIENALAKPALNEDSLMMPSTPSPGRERIHRDARDTVRSATHELPPDEQVNLELRSIHLEELKLKYTTAASRWQLSIKALEGFMSYRQDTIACGVSSMLEAVSGENLTYLIPKGKVLFAAELGIDRTTKILAIKNGKVSFDKFSLDVGGTYAHQNNRFIDIDFDILSENAELMSGILRQESMSINSDLIRHANIYLHGTLKGEMANQLPRINVSFGMHDMSVRLPDGLGEFKNIGFDGIFSSGSQDDYSEAQLELKDIVGDLPGGTISGYFRLRNLKAPYLDYNLYSSAKLDGWDKLWRIESVGDLKGKVILAARYLGPLENLRGHESDSLGSFNLEFEDVSFILASTGRWIKGFSGRCYEANNLLSLRDFHFNYDESELRLEGTIENLVHFALDKEYVLRGNLTIHSDSFFTNHVLPTTSQKARIDDRATNLNLSLKFSTYPSEFADSAFPDVRFEIGRLSAQFEKLADIGNLLASGTVSQAENGTLLLIDSVHAELPLGIVEISNGSLLMPRGKNLQISADLKATKFPWIYINNLVSEMRSTRHPIAGRSRHPDRGIMSCELSVSANVRSFPFAVSDLEVHHGSIMWEKNDTTIVNARGVEVVVRNLFFENPPNSGKIMGLRTVEGDLYVRDLSLPMLHGTAFQLNFEGANNLLNMTFFSKKLLANNESGRFDVDFSGSIPAWKFKYTTRNASIEDLLNACNQQEVIDGYIDISASLAGAGFKLDELANTLTGELQIEGDSLKLHGVQLDKLLTKYERSQKFNLVDLTAFALAGPMGAVVTKGSDFISVMNTNLDKSETTEVRRLVARWHVAEGVLHTQDVAFATKLNRVAFMGSFDFANDTIPGFTVAVVDKKGCSLIDQQVYGKTDNIQIGKANITRSIFGSVINFVNQLAGTGCKRIYSGSVEPPL